MAISLMKTIISQRNMKIWLMAKTGKYSGLSMKTK
jgi:hypothetical protein